jgi:hypothetical protein
VPGSPLQDARLPVSFALRAFGYAPVESGTLLRTQATMANPSQGVRVIMVVLWWFEACRNRVLAGR